MSKCPYCGAPMAEEHLPPTSGSKRELYKAIVKAGPDGIRLDDLHNKLMPGRASATVRTRIFYLNQVISRIGQRIVYRRDKDDQGRYFLTATSTGE